MTSAATLRWAIRAHRTSPKMPASCTSKRCGLLDRLIALEYGAQALTTVTLDHKMATLPGVTRLATRRAL